MTMSDKVDVNIDVTHLANVDPAVSSTLRVGQRLVLKRIEGNEALSLCTEAGVTLAPLPDTQLAAVALHAKVIVRAIKREQGTGAIQQLQVRIYPGDPGASGAGAQAEGVGAGAGPSGAGSGTAAAAGDGNADGVPDQDFEYKLRRGQYEALANSPELRSMLADPHLQGVLSRIESAQDREQALSAQLENPDFQGFVSQVLKCLDPERVPATAATAAAVAMAAR